MPRKKVITFNITPQTSVRATQGDKVWFQIPEDQLADKYPEGLKRKLRLVKYNEYRADLKMIAEYLNFTMPAAGVHLVFFIPVSASWRKSKKAAHHDQPHLNKPDIDNLLKAFLDGVLKEDRSIWDIRATKRWTNSQDGRIEISNIAIR